MCTAKLHYTMPHEIGVTRSLRYSFEQTQTAQSLILMALQRSSVRMIDWAGHIQTSLHIWSKGPVLCPDKATLVHLHTKLHKFQTRSCADSVSRKDDYSDILQKDGQELASHSLYVRLKGLGPFRGHQRYVSHMISELHDWPQRCLTMEVTGKPHISVTKTGNNSLVLDTFYTTDMPITNQHIRSEF
jgi:hypothetical protein